jgi:hypothetical protein
LATLLKNLYSPSPTFYPKHSSTEQARQPSGRTSIEHDALFRCQLPNNQIVKNQFLTHFAKPLKRRDAEEPGTLREQPVDAESVR